ncbi:hypothetical protein QYF61_010278 [Mycteria americana]|uniref:Uncharacterized protein n=1 Tax=Mycteria americana TaxID=33587 RepID=A0AAN7MI89_MYCAM|nr:hypothetical protein QYF61_010278 [Mycteria americana]
MRECFFITCVDGSPLRSADTTVVGRTAIPRDVARLEGWANRNLMICNQDKSQVLPLRWAKALQRQRPATAWAEQPQLSEPVLVGEVLQPSDHFPGPPLDPLQQLHVLLVLRAPELDAVLQVGSHQSRVEGQNHLPRPYGHTSFDAAQDMVGLLGCERTLSAHVQLFVHQYPQVLFCRAALDHIIPQPVLKPRIAPTQV